MKYLGQQESERSAEAIAIKLKARRVTQPVLQYSTATTTSTTVVCCSRSVVTVRGLLQYTQTLFSSKGSDWPTLWSGQGDRRRHRGLTGDADRGLAALGSSQVAPGHAEAPEVLRAVEVLHLLTGHVDHHLTHLQP